MDYNPSDILQCFIFLLVSLDIPLNLLHPIIRIFAFFQTRFQLFPIFSVKELTVTKYRDMVFCQSNIRSTW